jgi:DNA-binding IclR family transcriptional regulator
MPRYPSQAPRITSSKEGGVVAVDRALLLLTAFQEGERSVSLQQLTDRSGLVRSTVLRMLVSLQHFQLVRRLDDNRYVLGPAIPRLNRVFVSSFQLESVVPQALVALVDQTRESASFHVRQGNMRLQLYRVHSPQPLSESSQVGDVFPLTKGSGGRVMLAFAGVTGALYDRVRTERVLSLVGERVPEIAGISAPVFDGTNALVGVITITVPTIRYRPELVEQVKTAAMAVTAALGGEFEQGRVTPYPHAA